tara:strand:- start:14381 stop:14965 length:585 start_codon:yes stop_codon:yes gene_type:complete
MYFDRDFSKPQIGDDYNKLRTLVQPGPGVPAAFGCSFTKGTGVEEKLTWPSLLGIVNCGLEGNSNDKIVRMAINYCNEFKPEKIYVMWTFATRREIIDDTGETLRFKTEANYNTAWFASALEQSNEFSDNYNYEKNQLLLQCYCMALNIDIKELTVTKPFDHAQMNSYGSDGTHPGKEWHEAIFKHISTPKMVL